jgi:hypothetical protein
MPFIGSDTGGGGGLGALVAQLSQTQGGMRPHPRRLDDFIRPVDQNLTAKIQAAIGEGLNPEVAMQLMGAVGGGISERYGAYQDRRATRQAAQQEQMQALPGLAGQAFEFAQAGVPQAATEAAFSGYGGRTGATLDDIVGGIYGAPGAGVQLDPEDTMNVMQFATQATQAAQQAGAPMDFQTVFWGTGQAPGISRHLLQAGFTGPEFDAAKELIRSEWHRIGGTPDAGPVAQPTIQQVAPAPAGASALTGGSWGSRGSFRRPGY